MVIIYTSFEIESSSLNMTLLIEKVKTRNNPGLVVMGRDSLMKVVGSNTGAIYWMDMIFFTLICCKNCIVCLKRPKISKKEAEVGPVFLKNSY